MIRFDDREYRRSHMKAPRGRGSWAFAPVGDHGPIDEEVVFYNGTLGEAKAQARAHFADAAGDVYIAVLP